jgi:hypothetical protein
MNAKQNGVVGEYFDNTSLSGEPKIKRIDKDIDFNFGSSGPVKVLGMISFLHAGQDILKRDYG